MIAFVFFMLVLAILGSMTGKDTRDDLQKLMDKERKLSEFEARQAHGRAIYKDMNK